jgi:hypothetical protein
MFKITTTAMTIALACAAASARADDISDYIHFQAGIGAAHYTTQDGRWYQQGMPDADNHLDSKPPAFSLGFTGPVISHGRWGVDWHAEYVNLGRAAAECACTPLDANYNSGTHTYTPKIAVPPAYFTGEGRSQGVALTIEPYYWLYGVRFGVEAGAYIHRDSWTDTVYDWQMPNAGATTLVLQSAYWSVAPAVGVSVGNGRFTLSYRHYFTGLNSRNRSVPPLWNDADVLELKVKF